MGLGGFRLGLSIEEHWDGTEHDHDHQIFLYLLRGVDMIGRALELRGHDIYVFYSCKLWCDVQKYPYFQSN